MAAAAQIGRENLIQDMRTESPELWDEIDEFCTRGADLDALMSELRFPRSSCANCNYDLYGSLSGVCPECGHQAELDALERKMYSCQLLQELRHRYPALRLEIIQLRAQFENDIQAAVGRKRQRCREQALEFYESWVTRFHGAPQAGEETATHRVSRSSEDRASQTARDAFRVRQLESEERAYRDAARSEDDRKEDSSQRVRITVVILAVVFLICCGVSSFINFLPVKIRSTPTPTVPSVNQSQAPQLESAAFASPVQGAVIAGQILYTGSRPTPSRLNTASDPMCTVPRFSEDLVVGAGGTLQNVVVYIAQGLPSDLQQPAPSKPLYLGSSGCRCDPHILAVQVGQPVWLYNADPTAINWTIVGKRNPPVNIGQPKQGMSTVRRFTAPERAIPVRDGIHPWLYGYLYVFGHSYFNVTTSAGLFRLEGLPAGTYVVEAWHEKLGVKQQTVTVKNGELVKIQFTY